MRLFLFCSFCFCLLHHAVAQAQQPRTERKDSVGQRYSYQEQMPVFPGGTDALFRLLTDSLRYPASALRDKVQGKVYLAFVVGPTGQVTDIRVQQGVRADLDAEALRVAQRLTRVRWQPGTQNDRPVAVSFTFPLKFGLSEGGIAADSLDVHPGPTIVLPRSSWSARQQHIPADLGVIYGSCLQRLGFSSGGLPQYVRLQNVRTGKVIRILVKPAMRSRQENAFCVALAPGRYALQWYEYSYGTETLRKGASGKLADSRYQFDVAAGQLHYVGTWDFTQPANASFRDEKRLLDAQVSAEYPHLKFAEAITYLPQ